MFGMALRTYHDRVARLAESQSESGRSLWDAVLAHVQQHGTSCARDVLRRFSRDGDAMVRGVLRDLVSSGLRVPQRAGRPHDLSRRDAGGAGRRRVGRRPRRARS